jgi:hypothetical protein
MKLDSTQSLTSDTYSLYISAEDPTATIDFTNFFTPAGTLIVLSYKAHGSDDIIKLKDTLLPPNGHKQWDVIYILDHCYYYGS